MKIQHVPVEYVNQTWPLVEKFIDESVAQSKGDFTTEQIKVYVTSGQWMLVVAVDDAGDVCGGMTINFFNRPDDRVAFVTATGGKLIISPETFDQLKAIAKTFGATCVEAAGRESMVRLLSRCGFEEKYRIVGAKL